MSASKCECSMAIAVLGDGCRYCQPQEYIDRLGEWLDEERARVAELDVENERLRMANADCIAWERACKADLDRALARAAKLTGEVAIQNELMQEMVYTESVAKRKEMAGGAA